MLHKAKLLGDAVYAINKAANDAAAEMSEEAKKRKMVAAAPEWLKGRVERGEELLCVQINCSSHGSDYDYDDVDDDDEEEEEDSDYDDDYDDEEEDEMTRIADVVEFVTGGKMPREVFVDLMGYLVPKWDETRRA